MRTKAFMLEFALTAALFAATSTSARSIPFCKNCGAASPRPDPVGAGVIESAAPRPHGGAVLNAENFGFSVTNDDNGAAIAAAVREAKRVGAGIDRRQGTLVVEMDVRHKRHGRSLAHLAEDPSGLDVGNREPDQRRARLGVSRHLG